MTHDVFSKFNDAFAAVALAATTTRSPAYRRLCLNHENLFKVAQRFYMPDGRFSIEGRELSADLIANAHLPFPAVATLFHDTRHHPNGKVDQSISIALAVDARDPLLLSQLGSSFDPRVSAVPPELPCFYVTSVSFAPDREQWALTPAVGLFCPRADGKHNLHVIELSELAGLGIEWGDSIRPDVLATLNLCVLLTLRNVTTDEVRPSAALNKARARRGKEPLSDYHVLVVDGERWDRTASGGVGDGYRSHYRRGHVRRLDDAHRVWVRSTVVTGRKDGFVTKDYHVKGPLQ